MNPRIPTEIAPQAIAFDRSGQPSQCLRHNMRKFYIFVSPIFLCSFSWCSDLNLVPCFEYNPQAGAFDRSGQPPQNCIYEPLFGLPDMRAHVLYSRTLRYIFVMDAKMIKRRRLLIQASQVSRLTVLLFS